MDRPFVSVFLAASLDGFIAGPGGDLAWLDPYGTDSPEDTGYARLMQQADTLVMGRGTYEKLLTFDAWPYAGKRVVVLTRRGLAARFGETARAGALRDVLQHLWREGARHVYLDGGQTVRQGLDDGLVDELTLSWVPVILGPVILGEGIALFSGLRQQSAFVAQDVRRLPSGLVQVMYHPDRRRTADQRAGETHETA